MSVPAASEIAAQVDMDANGSFQRSCAALPNLNMPVSSTPSERQASLRQPGAVRGRDGAAPSPERDGSILNLADESSPEHIEYMHAQTATNRVVALQHQKTEHLIESTVVAQLYN
jgi:hypothetical protein